ncbi:MAG: hypothetical protein PHN88_02880 [Ignavibacteria bacterium]|nr:hypothetical protein [Ignavibacteria bacterium]
MNWFKWLVKKIKSICSKKKVDLKIKLKEEIIEEINLIELKDNCLFKINNFLKLYPSELIKNIIIEREDIYNYQVRLAVEINKADINRKDIKSLTNTIELYINSFAKENKCTIKDIIFEIETDRTCKVLTLDCLF